MSPTVLVADDSQTIRQVVQMALKGSEFDVEGAESAREAVEAAQKGPEVILLDYYMPDGSGYDVCQSLKQNQATRHIPVVMLGGTYKEFDPALARQSGADGVVMKPFKTDELIDAVESAVEGGSAQPAQPQAAQQPSQPTPPPNQPQAPQQPSQTPPPNQPQPPQQPQKAAAPQQAQRQQKPTGPQNQPTNQPRRQNQPTGPQRQAQPQRQQKPTGQHSQPQPGQGSGSHPNEPLPSGGSSPGGQSPSQTPVPESQPRIPAGGQQSQSSSPSPSGPQQAVGSQPGSRPRTPTGGSKPGISTPDSSGDRQRKPTPPPGSGSGASAMPGSSMDRDEIENFITQQVKETVRAELPGLLRNVMGEIFQEKVLPKLLQHTDAKISSALDDKVEEKITRQVRLELERLLAEE